MNRIINRSLDRGPVRKARGDECFVGGELAREVLLLILLLLLQIIDDLIDICQYLVIIMTVFSNF